MIHYHVSFENPLTFYVQIQLTLDCARRGNRSRWNCSCPPGGRAAMSYRTFAQKIQRVVIDDADSGEALPFRKLTKDRWQVAGAAGRTVRVRYNFYAHQMDAGGSWLDESQLYLNAVQGFMYAEGRQQEPCELTLDLPEAGKLPAACPKKPPTCCKPTASTIWSIRPLIASPTLQHHEYEAAGHALSHLGAGRMPT